MYVYLLLNKVIFADTSKVALERIRATFQLDPSMPWPETLAVTHDESIDVEVNDDLKRELALSVFLFFATSIALIYC
jgi:hypothetical protein